MHPGRRAAVLLAAAGVVLSTGCSVFSDEPKPDPAAQAFLSAWGRGDVAAAAAATDDSAAAQATLRAVKTSLAPTRGELAAGSVSVDGDRATAAYTASWTLPGLSAPWRYDGRLALVRRDAGRLAGALGAGGHAPAAGRRPDDRRAAGAAGAGPRCRTPRARRSSAGWTPSPSASSRAGHAT